MVCPGRVKTKILMKSQTHASSSGQTVTPSIRPLAKSFEPAQFENELYKFWEETGCFEGADENVEGQKSYCIVIPPPNVTGVLHMGHALTNSIQDTLIRWRRMKGDNTLWIPGTDHAGIATQAQVEKQIAKEGKGPSGKPLTRHDLGREAFVSRVWKWKDDHGREITHQLKRLGSSLDWKRERFTMDEGLSSAVREVFVRLHEEGLIYRGERIINWCTRCQTALSDLEVIPTDRKGHFWHLIYKMVDDAGRPVKNADGTDAQLVIATTRPETLLGDTAVAVHPEDERYTHLHGKKAILPLVGRHIPVITDSYVDKEFGSGALKITPAHDFNDADLGKKHQLPILQVMGKDGRISAEGGVYAGLKFSEAREKMIADLTEAGLLVKVEDHAHKVGLCQRCDQVAEPMISKQWFVKIEPLAKPAIQAVETGQIEFSPRNWEKTYFEWMYNIRDWCISRQLWWGHQIPAWHCGDCENIQVLRSSPSSCSQCGGKNLKQDEDVLDTWFSSALWPFSTLGWPEKTNSLKTFYPTSVLETGFDIIFFWVSRMIMMGMHFMGDVPFKKVYLHAMVRDEKGEKMSKSKGNVIDPLVVINQHGADPLRFTLLSMAGQGRDIKLSVDRVEGYRAFCNKFWNATKFFHLQLEEANGGPVAEPQGGAEAWLLANHAKLEPQNRWILSRLQTAATRVEKGLSGFELNESAQALYEFTWHEFCDWFIEFSKLPLREGGARRTETLYTLHHVLETVMRLMHPLMPFVTEELWLSLPWKNAANTPARKRDGKPEVLTLMFQTWPDADGRFRDQNAEEEVSRLRAVIEGVRNFRGENNISPKVEFPLRFFAADSASAAFMDRNASIIRGLSRLGAMESVSRDAVGELDAIIPLSSPAVELRISLAGLVNVDEEAKRIKKEMENVEKDLAHVRNKLSKDTFIAKAPPALVEAEKANEQKSMGRLKELESALARLSKLGSN